MSLLIRQLETACRIPRRHRSAGAVVDQFARGRFAADLAAHLGPSLSRQPGVVRIRNLPIRITVAPDDLHEASLSMAWVTAFGRALFAALAYPSGAGPFEIFRAESIPAFVATAIRDLLDGTASGKWQYAEFHELFLSGVSEASVTLLTRWPQLTLSILVELQHSGALDKLLPRLDDLALERLFALLANEGTFASPSLASATSTSSTALSLADLVVIGELVLRCPPQRFATLRSRAYALKLYVQAHLAKESSPRSPRSIFHALTALTLLLSDDLTLLSSAIHGDSSAKQLPGAVVDFLQLFAREVHADPQSPRLLQVSQLFSDLRATLKLPPPSPAGATARSVASDWCGLFFLVSTLERLGWVAAWRQLSEFQLGGISPLLVGLALSIAGRFRDAPDALDPGVALFSGYFKDPDLFHLRGVFQEFPAETRSRVLHAAVGKEAGSQSWESTFEVLAAGLLQSFAAVIPGFQRTSPAGIARMFLQRQGRIRIEDERLLIQADPSPFHVALHIAGLDSPVSSVSWLAGRRIEFEIGEI
jgi:hypothetical protein